MDQQLKRNAEKMLNVLAEDGVDVIREMGIKGVPGMSTYCLVSQYLAETVGGGWFTSPAYTTMLDLDHSSGPDTPPDMRVPLPPEVQGIVKGFDSGEYPDLVK